MAEKRLIDANALDAALESAQKTLETNWEKQWKMNKGQVKGLAWARAILREVKSADVDAMIPRWISVEERLPEHWHMDDKDRTLINYLVYSPDYGVDVGNYIKPAKRWVCMGLPMNVTHWMPLPEPPEVNEK